MGTTSRASFALRLAPFVISFLATFGATFLQLFQPEGWTTPWWAAVGLAVAIAVGPGFGIAFEQMHRRDAEFGDKVAGSIIALHDSMLTLGEFDNASIGYTVFRLRRTPRCWKRGAQIRIFRLRLAATPSPSIVRWTWGKGILGDCWAQQRVVELDTAKHFQAVKAESRKQWRKDVPSDVRRGLSYADYVSIRDYRHVVAFPIKDRTGEYRGCLAIQVDSAKCRKLLCQPTGRPPSQWRKVVDKSVVSIADLLG